MDSKMKAKAFLEFLSKAQKSRALFKLDSIAPVRVWEYAAPTLVQGSRFTNRVPWNESSQFADKFFETYPILKDLDFSNLAIAGGAVVDLLLERTPKDIDIFVITGKGDAAESAAFAKKRIERFVGDIYELLSKKNSALNEVQAKKRLTNPNFKVDRKEFADLNAFNVTRFRNVYTVTVPNLSAPLQLIATPYPDLNAFFDHVDLQCTAVAYYNKEVLFSELGKFCYENLAVVLDRQFKDSEQVNRLVKYFNKGFDIILPHLDVSKIRTHNFQFELQEMLDLPYLDIALNNIHDNKLDVSFLRPSKRCEEETKPDEPKGMYPGAQANTGGQGVHKNISNLIHDKWQDFCYEGKGASYKNGFLERPLITERMIVNTYKTVENKVFEKGAIRLDYLEKFFTTKKLSAILDDLIVQYIRGEEAQGLPGVIVGPKFTRYLKDRIKDLVKEQIELTKDRLMALQKAELALPTDVIESKMMETTKEDWYGAYLKTDGPAQH